MIGFWNPKTSFSMLKVRLVACWPLFLVVPRCLKQQTFGVGVGWAVPGHKACIRWERREMAEMALEADHCAYLHTCMFYGGRVYLCRNKNIYIHIYTFVYCLLICMKIFICTCVYMYTHIHEDVHWCVLRGLVFQSLSAITLAT